MTISHIELSTISRRITHAFKSFDSKIEERDWDEESYQELGQSIKALAAYLRNGGKDGSGREAQDDDH